jgi:hypothetical protein
MFLNEQPAPQNIILNSTVVVKVENGTEATIIVPPELRLTQALFVLLQDAVANQGLKLTHMEISKEHVQELGNLENVALRQEEIVK